MIDWADYRTEILLAINEYVASAEKAAKEGRKSDALMYSNKCLALLQFGSKTRLVDAKEFRQNYDRLSVIIKSEE